jgi:hypothetical protein
MAQAHTLHDVHYQTARLGRGKHDAPGATVCVMEMASMLGGERFSDRPVSACPVLGALLRAYNDALDDRRRQHLRRFAAECVGTRDNGALQDRRAARLLLASDAWIAARSRTGRSFAALRRAPFRPCATDNPDAIAFYALAALGRIDDQAHTKMLSVLDELISLAPEPNAPTVTIGRQPIGRSASRRALLSALA